MRVKKLRLEMNGSMYYLFRRKKGEHILFIKIEQDFPLGKCRGIQWVEDFSSASLITPGQMRACGIFERMSRMKIKTPEVWITDCNNPTEESQFWKINDDLYKYWKNMENVKAVEDIWNGNIEDSLKDGDSSLDKFVQKLQKSELMTHKDVDELSSSDPFKDFQQIIEDANGICTFDGIKNKGTQPMINNLETVMSSNMKVGDWVLDDEQIILDSDSLIHFLFQHQNNSKNRKQQLQEQICYVTQGIVDVIEYLTLSDTDISYEAYLHLAEALHKLLVARNRIKKEYAKIQLIDKYLQNPESVNLLQVDYYLESRSYRPRILNELFKKEIDWDAVVDKYGEILTGECEAGDKSLTK